MVSNPNNPPPVPPQYEGPTSAEQFVDALGARRALTAIGHPVPHGLDVGAINFRLCIGSTPTHEDGVLKRVVFMDGSAAKRNRRGRWVVN